jgi:hypothetical protein
MSRTLKRPMFRRGGTVNDGIMTGLTDRKQYSIGGIDREQLGQDAKTISDILAEFAPIPKTRLPIGQFGLDIATGTPVGEALKSGYKTFTTQDDMRRAAMAKRKQGAVSTALSSQMAEQKFKMQQMLKDKRIALEQKVDYVKKIMGFETDKEALEYINTSLSDVSKLTPETRIGQKLKSMPVQNRNKAEYLTFLEPYIPAAKRSGTYIISDKNSFPKKPIKNKTYFDISTGTLYEFIGGEPRDITSYQDVTAKYNKENFTFK